MQSYNTHMIQKIARPPPPPMSPLRDAPLTTPSGVSRISFRGGGGSKFFLKNGGICIALRAKPRVCLGGSGAGSPEKIFKNGAIWCVYFAKIL